MHISKHEASLVALAVALGGCLCIAGGALAQQQKLLYVPIVKTPPFDQVLLPDGTPSYSNWTSSLGMFNNGDTVATFNQVAVYGEGSFLAQAPVCESTGMIAPHTGRGIGGCINPFPDRGVGFLAVQVSPGIVARADVTRSRTHCSCANPGCVTAPQGLVRMPIYSSLFPAGSTAVSGPVDLGFFDLPESCFSSNQQYRRRVNVTLFNAGDVAATFTLTLLPAQSSAIPIFQLTVVLAARDVLQVNHIPVPTQPDNHLYYGGGYRVWVQITADQPYLSYVSTVFDNPEPGALPSDVYPSYLEN